MQLEKLQLNWLIQQNNYWNLIRISLIDQFQDIWRGEQETLKLFWLIQFQVQMEKNSLKALYQDSIVCGNKLIQLPFTMEKLYKELLIKLLVMQIICLYFQVKKIWKHLFWILKNICKQSLKCHPNTESWWLDLKE